MAASGKGALRIAIEDFLETFGFGKVLLRWFVEGGEEHEDTILTQFRDVLDDIEAVPELPESMRWSKLIGLAGKGQGAIASVLGFGAQLGMGAASAFLAPVMRMLNYHMDKKYRTARVDPPTAWAMDRRAPGVSTSFINGLRELGWSEVFIEAWRQVTEPILSEGELHQLWLRGKMTTEALNKELKARGWRSDRIENFKVLSEIIPGVTDLVQMAVREAWAEDVAARFDYDADFPTEAAEWGEKLGLSKAWFQKYWRAHWALPGISTGYTMLHRLRPGTTDDPFTRDDMRTLLRVSDIPPFWRERLIDISMTLYTRVDVRRMYNVGVLDRAGVVASYRDLGYDEEKAENMTEFTVRLATTDARDLTKSAITGGYKRGILSESEALAALVEIGFSSEDADFFLSMIDYDLAQKEVDGQIDQAEFLYVSGEISEIEVHQLLGTLNLPATQVEVLIRNWNITIAKKRALPSRSDLDDFYRRDIISLDQWEEGLKRKRYSDDAIIRYGVQLDQKLAEEAAKELERSQKEQERLLKATKSTDYQKAKADLDLQIAELRLELSDLKVAIHFILAQIRVNEELARGELETKQIELRAERQYREAVLKADSDLAKSKLSATNREAQNILKAGTESSKAALTAVAREKQIVERGETALYDAVLVAAARGQAIIDQTDSDLAILQLRTQSELIDIRTKAETVNEEAVIELEGYYRSDVVLLQAVLKVDTLAAETPEEVIDLWRASKLREVTLWVTTQTDIIQLLSDTEEAEVLLAAEKTLKAAQIELEKTLDQTLLTAKSALIQARLTLEPTLKKSILAYDTALIKAKLSLKPTLDAALLAASQQLNEDMIVIEKTDKDVRIALEAVLKSDLNKAAATARENLITIRIELDNALIHRDVLKQAISTLQVSKATIRTEMY